MIGDGYTSVRHCENADVDPSAEADSGPIHCKEADRDRLLGILRKIDAECQKFEGGTPLPTRWTRIKQLAREGASYK
jgi:hypothetical protein